MHSYLRRQTLRRLYANVGVPLAGWQYRHVVQELLEAGDQILAVARAIRDDLKDLVRHERRKTAAHLAEVRRGHNGVLARRQTRLRLVHLAASVRAGAVFTVCNSIPADNACATPPVTGDGPSNGHRSARRRSRRRSTFGLEIEENEARGDWHLCEVAQKNGSREPNERHERALEQRHFANQNVHSLRATYQLLEETVVVLL